MVKQENPNFIASKYAPNPKEVSYWIDLATDSTGNVIKSYSPDLKKWIPLNRDANVDQWTHIKEIVQSVGLNYDKNSDIISLPDNSSNNYFKGTSIVDAINKGDAAVKAQVDRLDTKIDDVNEDLQDFKALKGQPNGLAELDGNGKVPASQLPSYVDDVLEVYATYDVSHTGGLTNVQLYTDAGHQTPVVGESGKIYINVADGEPPYQFRWSGTKFVDSNTSSLIIGEIAGTAFEGSRGKHLEDVVSSMPKNLISKVSIVNKNKRNVIILCNYSATDGQGHYIDKPDGMVIPLTPATTREAGLMDADSVIKLNQTLPDAIEAEQEARIAKDNEIKASLETVPEILLARSSNEQGSLLNLGFTTTGISINFWYAKNSRMDITKLVILNLVFYSQQQLKLQLV